VGRAQDAPAQASRVKPLFAAGRRGRSVIDAKTAAEIAVELRLCEIAVACRRCRC
jgi:hypothetical protein